MQSACSRSFSEQFRTSQSHNSRPCHGGYEYKDPADHGGPSGVSVTIDLAGDRVSDFGGYLAVGGDAALSPQLDVGLRIDLLPALSPGMRYRHYAPRAVVTLVQGPEDHVVPLLRKLCKEQETSGKRSCVLCFSEHVSLLSDCNPHDIGSSSAPSETAHRLFDILRQLDDEGMEMVFSEVVPPEGVGLAVMNRLGRAASFRIIQA